MNGISFEEDQQQPRMAVAAHARSTLTKLVISLGLAKTEKDANYVMIAFIVIAVFFIAGIYYISTPHNPVVQINPQSPQFEAEFDVPHPAAK